MKVLELFAGIGACSTALKRIGIDIEIVDAVEIDKYAMASFNSIHGTNFEVQDIVEYNKVFENLDIITHGSPCQDFSVAGKQAGGDLGSGTRSSLMYETIRIVGQNRPKYVLWENVKNLLSAKHKHNFDKYIETLETLGYNSYYQVLNAKDYGIPQNRERVYTISIRKDIDKGEFRFPQKEELKLRLKDMLEEEVQENFFLKYEQTKQFTENNKKENNIIGNLNIPNWHELTNRVYDINSYSPTIHAMEGGNIKPKILIKNGTKKGYDKANRIYDEKGLAPTLTQQEEKVMTNRIRKLTPKECWRLMGFSDEDFEKAANIPTSNTQLYKQARK